MVPFHGRLHAVCENRRTAAQLDGRLKCRYSSRYLNFAIEIAISRNKVCSISQRTFAPFHRYISTFVHKKAPMDDPVDLRSFLSGILYRSNTSISAAYMYSGFCPAWSRFV
jgi:hypothetical protein